MYGKKPNPGVIYAVITDAEEPPRILKVLDTWWDDDHNEARGIIAYEDGTTDEYFIGRDDYDHYANVITYFLNYRKKHL